LLVGAVGAAISRTKRADVDQIEVEAEAEARNIKINKLFFGSGE
jgi:hypothetical protein